MSESAGKQIRQASMDQREALDPQNIERFLREKSGDASVTVSDIEAPKATGVSSGGLFLNAHFSNGQTEHLFLKYDTQSAVRPFHIYDLKGQFTVQSVMAKAGLPVPQPLYLDEDGSLVGRPSFIMRVVGGKPGSARVWLEGALAKASEADRDAMLSDAIAKMVQMHTIDIDTPELAFLYDLADGSNSIEREINWSLDLAKYHKFSDPRIDQAAETLRRTQPQEFTDVFNHGDNKLDNYLFDTDHVSAILDFEMVNIAPREMDLAYLLFTTRALTPPGNAAPDWWPNAEGLIAAYEAAGGQKVTNFAYYQDLIAFKFSIMVLAFVANLGLLEKSPEMYANYWAALESISD